MPTGNAVPPIFGIALDGGNTAEITDTDDGAIDGDAEFDRAVGPMQLIPQTWRNWHIDGGGDGVEDPQNIDDAALAAANYLCRSSIDDGHRGRLARRDLGLQLERHVPVERGRRSRRLHGGRRLTWYYIVERLRSVITRGGCAFGELPKRPKGSDCKSDCSAFGGSNPSLATRCFVRRRLCGEPAPPAARERPAPLARLFAAALRRTRSAGRARAPGSAGDHG